MHETILVWGATFSYGTSAILLLWPSGKNPDRAWMSYCYLVIGVVMLALALMLRWVELAQGPFMTLYEVLVSNAFSVGLIYAVVFYFVPLCRQGAVLLLPFLFILASWAVSVPADPVPLPATFDNYLLWFHVLAGKLFLGFCAIAVSLSGIMLLHHFKIKPMSFVFAGELVSIDSHIWRLMAVAFTADSIMLVVGAVWAYDAWGRYWAWDPLETWALITWLTLGASLHIRLTFNIPAWSGWIMVILVFVLAFLTFFGVPFLSLAPHKGIF